jgi:hypothetical protein
MALGPCAWKLVHGAWSQDAGSHMHTSKIMHESIKMAPVPAYALYLLEETSSCFSEITLKPYLQLHLQYLPYTFLVTVMRARSYSVISNCRHTLMIIFHLERGTLIFCLAMKIEVKQTLFDGYASFRRRKSLNNPTSVGAIHTCPVRSPNTAQIMVRVRAGISGNFSAKTSCTFTNNQCLWLTKHKITKS